MSTPWKSSSACSHCIGSRPPRPIALADIGLEGTGRDELRKVAEAACAPGETIHNEPFPVHVSMVVDAMLSADAYARERRRNYPGEMPTPAA